MLNNAESSAGVSLPFQITCFALQKGDVQSLFCMTS